jgi:flagellar protein FlaF
LGFSVAAAAAILFAGGLVSLTVVMQANDSASKDLRDARELADKRTADQLNTRISLINGTANGTAVEFNLTNNGSVIIHLNTLEVLVNGTLLTGAVTLRTVDGASSTNLWAPGQTLHMRLTGALSGPATVKVVTDTGYSFTGGVN